MRWAGWLIVLLGVAAIGWAIGQTYVDAPVLMAGCAMVVSGAAILLSRQGMDVLGDRPDEPLWRCSCGFAGDLDAAADHIYAAAGEHELVQDGALDSPTQAVATMYRSPTGIRFEREG